MKNGDRIKLKREVASFYPTWVRHALTIGKDAVSYLDDVIECVEIIRGKRCLILIPIEHFEPFKTGVPKMENPPEPPIGCNHPVVDIRESKPFEKIKKDFYKDFNEELKDLAKLRFEAHVESIRTAKERDKYTHQKSLDNTTIPPNSPAFLSVADMAINASTNALKAAKIIQKEKMLDHFATEAMKISMSKREYYYGEIEINALTETSYDISEAMIKEREKRLNKG